MVLADLETGRRGTVAAVRDRHDGDPVARRLRDLGFVAGEQVCLLTRGPLGSEPLLVQVGFTRFAMRRAEAERVRVQPLGD